MTLSDCIAALDGPDRAMELRIAQAVGANGVWECKPFAFHHEYTKPYLRSIDAAMTLASPALQAHIAHETLKLMDTRGVIVGKFAEQFARTYAELALKEKGL